MDNVQLIINFCNTNKKGRPKTERPQTLLFNLNLILPSIQESDELLPM